MKHHIVYSYILLYLHHITVILWGVFLGFRKKNAGPSGDENGRRIHQHGRGVVVDVDGQPNGVEKDDPLDVAGDVDGKHANANGSHKKISITSEMIEVDKR